MRVLIVQEKELQWRHDDDLNLPDTLVNQVKLRAERAGRSLDDTAAALVRGAWRHAPFVVFRSAKERPFAQAKGDNPQAA